MGINPKEFEDEMENLKKLIIEFGFCDYKTTEITNKLKQTIFQFIKTTQYNTIDSIKIIKDAALGMTSPLKSTGVYFGKMDRTLDAKQMLEHRANIIYNYYCDSSK